MAKELIPTTASQSTVLRATRLAVRWSARLTAIFLLSLVLYIIIAEVFFGNGGPNLAKEGWRFGIMTVAGLTALAGFAVLWWREFLGGLLVLGGITVFYWLNFLASGKFPGGLFPWFYLPGVLAVLSWYLSRRISISR
jgi:hypothetical protein